MKHLLRMLAERIGLLDPLEKFGPGMNAPADYLAVAERYQRLAASEPMSLARWRHYIEQAAVYDYLADMATADHAIRLITEGS